MTDAPKSVFAAMFTDCYHESAMSPISLHWTHKGAEKAIKRHKRKERSEHQRLYAGVDKAPHPWSDDEGDGMMRWGVVEMEVKQ